MLDSARSTPWSILAYLYSVPFNTTKYWLLLIAAWYWLQMDNLIWLMLTASGLRMCKAGYFKHRQCAKRYSWERNRLCKRNITPKVYFGNGTCRNSVGCKLNVSQNSRESRRGVTPPRATISSSEPLPNAWRHSWSFSAKFRANSICSVDPHARNSLSQSVHPPSVTIHLSPFLNCSWTATIARATSLPCIKWSCLVSSFRLMASGVENRGTQFRGWLD